MTLSYYVRDGTGRDGTGRDGTGRDGTGRDGTGRDGTGRDGTGRDGTGRDWTGFTGSDIPPYVAEHARIMSKAARSILNTQKDVIQTIPELFG